MISYGPRRAPARDTSPTSISRAAARKAGVSRNVLSPSASKESTSRLSDSSPPQAALRNPGRPAAGIRRASRYSSAIRSQRSRCTAPRPVLGVAPVQLARQPRLGHFPVTGHRVLGHVEGFSGLHHAQAAEEPQLDDLASP